MTPRSWEHWKERYESRGYTVLAPAWPGHGGRGRGAERRPRPDRRTRHRADRGPLRQDHPEPRPPAGDHGPLVRRRVHADPAGPRPRRRRRRRLVRDREGDPRPPVVDDQVERPRTAEVEGQGRRRSRRRSSTTRSRTPCSEEESNAIYERYAVPGPTTVLHEGAFANFHRNPPTKVDFDREGRAPMLLIGFGEDHVIPAKVSPPPGGEVRRRGDDHRVQALRGPSALPRSAGLGGGRRLRARVGDGAREQDGRRARRRRHRVALSPRGRAPEAPIRSVASPRRARRAGTHPSGRRVRSP